MRLSLASIITLGILFGFIFSIILTAAFVLGYMEWYVLILLTIAVNFFIWLLSPYLGDFINKIFYKMEFIGIEDVRKKDPEVAEFIEKTCIKNKIKVPKIGYINDDNPQAFTYGSAAFNARVVFTEGIFTYLNTEERKSVLGHELGHIVHRDFIVMAIASIILQLLYETYWILARSRGRKKGGLAAVGIISYIFYWIGTYIVLYLSRLREYYADEFSGQETRNPNALASALIKIAYGILAKPDKPNEIRLMKSTRSLGITDYKSAKQTGLLYADAVQLKSWEPIEKSFLFDLKNPWSFFIELSSTHPLTGKRIRKLCDLSLSLGLTPMFDFAKIENYPIDRKRLYAGFFKDVFIQYLPVFSVILGVIFLFSGSILSSFFPFLQSGMPFASFFIVLFGISIIVQTIYRYREGVYSGSTVLDLMGDVYASPIRGKPIKLTGRIVGKGIPGFIFSEDMMMQDKTGLIYLNYESLIPLFGNLAFAWKKVNKLIGETCSAEGWFVRSMAPRLELKRLITEKETIKGRVKTIGLTFGGFMILLGLALLAISL